MTHRGSAQNMQQVVAGQNANDGQQHRDPERQQQRHRCHQGVTLSLSQTGASTVAVKQDTKTIETGVQSFVTAYNNLQSTITSLSAYDASTKTAQPLTGDSTLQVLQQQLRSVLNAAQSGSGSGANAIKTLAQAGVTFQKDGTLSFDSTTLDSALSSNPNGVAALFANTNGVSGYGNQINSLVTSMTGTNGAPHRCDQRHQPDADEPQLPVHGLAGHHQRADPELPDGVQPTWTC